MAWRFAPAMKRSFATTLKHGDVQRRILPSRSRVPSVWSTHDGYERFNAPQTRQITTAGPSPGPNTSPNALQDPNDSPGSSEAGDGGTSRANSSKWKGYAFRVFETASTTLASVLVLGLAGYGYHLYYKNLVLRKMAVAFEPGDPVLDLAARPSLAELVEDPKEWVRRKEQDIIDAIVSGEEKGHYWLLIGEKGVGKSSMLLEAMQQIDGEGIAMFEAHADLEIFRIRLGKALNYEFHEDYIGSLFSIKGPRDTTALLDIERAFNKLEKIAMQRRAKVGRPLVIIINCMHLLRHDEDGQDLLELIQQRAEQWAASNLVTVVLNSDDYWVYERLKQLATRLEVIPVLDLPKSQALEALIQYRSRHYENEPAPPPEILQQIFERIGGRLTFLNRVAKSPDMLRECNLINERERTWFLNQCGILGAEMDDDVMDQQKYASAAMVLAKALVDMEDTEEWKQEAARRQAEGEGAVLPHLQLHEARQVMTRADFIQQYDHVNIFTIDSRARVRADSVPMMNAFRDVCRRPGFDEYLEATLERIGDIESLGRTRELVAKDLWDKRYRLKMANGKEIVVDIENKEEEKKEKG